MYFLYHKIPSHDISIFSQLLQHNKEPFDIITFTFIQTILKLLTKYLISFLTFGNGKVTSHCVPSPKISQLKRWSLEERKIDRDESRCILRGATTL